MKMNARTATLLAMVAGLTGGVSVIEAEDIGGAIDDAVASAAASKKTERDEQALAAAQTKRTRKGLKRLADEARRVRGGAAS